MINTMIMAIESAMFRLGAYPILRLALDASVAGKFDTFGYLAGISH